MAAITTIALCASGLAALTTTAILTDSDTLGANTFSTSTVSLTLSPSTALLTASGMLPGDKVTAALSVTNAGTASLRYAVVSTTDATDNNLLAAKMLLRVRSGVSSCTTANFDASGADVYGTSVATTNILGSTTGTAIIGNVAQGSQAGDRTLASSASETLCFQASLPLNADNTYANKTVTASFTFSSEQTVNNP